MIGRYFVLNREVKKSEKYFAALYKLTNSFDLKYNTPCGLTYAYHPVVALAYAGTSLIHSIDLKQLVLTSIDMEIVRTPLFREPADVLKVIHAAREGKGGVRH